MLKKNRKTNAWLTLPKVSSLRARLGNRHAEKLIPPHELENIQSLWDESNENEKCDIFAELDEYDRDEMKRLFTLLARQSKSIFHIFWLLTHFRINFVKLKWKNV